MSDFRLVFQCRNHHQTAIALLNMLVAFGLSLIVYFVYKKSFSGWLTARIQHHPGHAVTDHHNCHEHP